MSVMSVSTVTMPRLSRRTRAADFVTRLLRNAAATPTPISQRPSRTLAGQRDCVCPSRSARRRCAGTRRSCRCENGRGGLSFWAFACDWIPTTRAGWSGTTCVSLTPNSIGSSPSFSAISSMAISSAIMPEASPGARMALPSGRSSTDESRCGKPVGARIEHACLRYGAVWLAIRANCRTSFRGRWP